MCATEFLEGRGGALHLARVLREQGRGEEAMASADEATRVAPRFVPGLALRALLSREAGRGDAPELERRARKLAKGTWAESWLDARAAMEGGRWDAAASAYETLLARGSEGRGAYVGWEHEALVGAGIANLRSQNLERAIERLGGARSKFGSSIEIDLLLAKAYHLAGPGRSATRSDEVLIQRFRESRGSEADDIAAAAFEAYLDIGELRTAREWVGRLSPGAKQVQLRGRLLRSTGRVGPSDDLQSVLDGLELVRLGGNEPWIHVCLGNAYITLRMFEEADRWFSKATDLAPRDPAPLVGLGVSAYLRGKLQEARRTFEAALGLDSGSVRAHYNLGVVLTDMGLDEEAEVQYASALGLDANHALSLNNRGVLLDGRGLLLDAAQHYERAVRAAPLLDIPRYNLARALHRQGEYRRAAAEYREAIRLGGKQAIIHGNLANCLFHLRRLDEACVEYGLALSLDPQSARAHHGLGVTLIHLSRYEDALQPLSRAVQIESVWANARNDYASTLEEVGRSADALGQYKELVRNHPDFVHAYNNLASLILRQRMQISDEGEQDELYRLFEDALHLPGADQAVDTLLAEWRRSLPFGRLTYEAIDVFLDPPESIVGEGSSWQYWDGPPLPFDDLSWTEDGFDDGSWKTGESGFASSEGKGVGTVIGGGGGSDASLFLRRRFSVSDRARVRRLIFRVRSAGGWIVYINGKECQRLLAGAPNLREGPQVTVVGADRPWVERRIHLDEGLLRDGENVLAIHALHPAGTSEFGVWPSLEAEVPFEGPARVRAEEALRLGRATPHGPEEESRLVYLEAGILERSGDFAAAESLYRRVLAAETRRPEPALRVAACLEARGSSREALDFLRQRLDLSRTSHLAMFHQWLRLAMGAVGLAAEEVLGDLGQLPENPLPLVRDALWPLGELAAGNAVRINCGGLDFLEPGGRSWSHDRLFLGGVPFFLFRLEESGIELDAPHLYQTERFFPEPHPILPGYEIPLPKGSYKVTLRFVEGHFTERGIRSFGVRVEGRDIADNLEPLGAGFGIPQSLERTVTVDDGALNIDFRRVLENPKISAIEVERN